MEALNWQVLDNYKYLDKLDDRGWAWEFIRRSPSYRAAYAEIAALSPAERSAKADYFPNRLETETENAWKMRVDDQLGTVAQRVSKGQYRARTQWSLKDLYSPDQIYDEKIIKYIEVNPYPAFYADPEDLPENVKAEHAATLRKLHHPSDLHDGPLMNSSTIIVLFDARRGMDAQIEKADRFLKKYAGVHDRFRNETTLHRTDWKNLIRMLDAINCDAELPFTAIIKEIDKTKSTQDAEGRQLSRIASRVKKRALSMAETGFQGLIFNVQKS